MDLAHALGFPTYGRKGDDMFPAEIHRLDAGIHVRSAKVRHFIWIPGRRLLGVCLMEHTAAISARDRINCCLLYTSPSPRDS